MGTAKDVGHWIQFKKEHKTRTAVVFLEIMPSLIINIWPSIVSYFRKSTTKFRLSRHWEYKRKKRNMHLVVEASKDCIKYWITRTIVFNFPCCDPRHSRNNVMMWIGTLLSVLKIPNQCSLQVPRLIRTIDPVPWLTQMACREPNSSWLEYLSRVSCWNSWITCPGFLAQIVGLLVQGFLPE